MATKTLQVNTSIFGERYLFRLFLKVLSEKQKYFGYFLSNICLKFNWMIIGFLVFLKKKTVGREVRICLSFIKIRVPRPQE